MDLTKPYHDFIEEVNTLSGGDIDVTAERAIYGPALIFTAVSLVGDKEYVAQFTVPLNRLHQNEVPPDKVASHFVKVFEKLPPAPPGGVYDA